MGGGLKSDEHLIVVFEIDGPIEKAQFAKFNAELRTLMQKYGVKKHEEIKWKK